MVSAAIISTPSNQSFLINPSTIPLNKPPPPNAVIIQSGLSPANCSLISSITVELPVL
jgi:hypothetical protein